MSRSARRVLSSSSPFLHLHSRPCLSLSHASVSEGREWASWCRASFTCYETQSHKGGKSDPYLSGTSVLSCTSTPTIHKELTSFGSEDDFSFCFWVKTVRTAFQDVSIVAFDFFLGGQPLWGPTLHLTITRETGVFADTYCSSAMA